MIGARLKSLRMEAFRSFRDETTVLFPEKGLVCLNGTSGAGKTNVLRAIAAAFGYSDLPSTAFQSWETETPWRIQVVFEDKNGTECIITRGASGSNLIVGNEKPIKSAGAIQERLNTLVGLKPDILENLVYRQQRKHGLFLSMDDAEKKEFLTTLLDLGKYEKEIDDATKRATSLAKTLTENNDAVYFAMGAIPREIPEPTLTDLAELKAEILKADGRHSLAASDAAEAWGEYHTANETFEEQVAEFSASQKIEKTDTTKLKSDLAEVQKRIETASSEHTQAGFRRAMQVGQIRFKLQELQREARNIPLLRNRVAQNEEKLKSLLLSKCPTCQQAWHSELEIDAARDAIKTDTEALAEAETQAASIEPLEAEVAEKTKALPQPPVLEKLKGVESAIKTRLALAEQADRSAALEVKNKVLAFKSEKEGAILTIKSGCIDLDKKANEAEAALKELKFKFSQATKENTRKTDEFLAYKKFAAGAKEKLAAVVATRDATQLELNRELDAVAAIKGFLNNIFDEVLAEIAEETNTILVGIPNVSRCTIEFKTDTVNLKGTPKRAIVPVVTVNGHETLLKVGCSGGMQSSIELAVDLAVSLIVSRRTGAVPMWMVLDEAFDGLSSRDKESGLEILQKVAHEKLVLFTSHVPEFKEFFTTFIDVENQNGISVIT